MTDARLPLNDPASTSLPDAAESLFERFPWLYAFCRDHLFRDDTARIAAALWPGSVPPAGCELLEVGCGPGFYTRRLASTFEQLRTTGIDRSEKQLRRARFLAGADGLDNCRFHAGDARGLEIPDTHFDAVVASRLFVVLSERRAVLAEMHRVLKPGGRCFVAEPRSALRASAPLRAMWLLATLSGSNGSPVAYREPGRVLVMTPDEFGGLISTQPWASVRRWQDPWYQYAVCEKIPV